MGVYIKGMEMPRRCCECRLSTCHSSLLDGMVMTGYQSRALDCISDFYVPTIIPAEEGRVMPYKCDRDCFNKNEDGWCKDEWCRNPVPSVPSIIEAEE